MKQFYVILFTACFFLGLSTTQAAPLINTVAGGWPNNIPASSAALETPSAVAADNDGNLYFAISNSHIIYKVDAGTGLLTHVAGTGSPGSMGNEGQATAAQLNNPVALSIDSFGHLYVAEEGNNAIRRIDKTTGIITIVAGIGPPGFSGDSGLATAAQLNSPQGITFDHEGHLLIADFLNHRIRQVDLTTGIITTSVGTGNANFSGDGGQAIAAELFYPSDVTVDSQGNIFIADAGNQRIRRVDQSSGVITTLGSPFLPQDFVGIEVDSAGHVIVAHKNDHRIQRVDVHTGLVSTIVGTGVQGFSGDGAPAISAQLSGPRGVAFNSVGDLFIADGGNNRIRQVSGVTDVITTVAGNGNVSFSGDSGPATTAQLYEPRAVAVDPIGNLFVADSRNHRIRRVDNLSGIITTVAGTGDSGYAGDNGLAVNAALDFPTGVAVDVMGNVLIADRANHCVRRIDKDSGVITTVAGTGVSGYSGDDGLATQAQLALPSGVAVDSARNVFIADLWDHRVRRVDGTTGIISTIAGIGTSGTLGDGGLATEAQLGGPIAVVLDSMGNLFIADSLNDRIRRVDMATGIITTVAGNGTSGFSGDGGLAVAARLNSPAGVAVDGLGHLYIADRYNNRIRRVDAVTGIITTAAGGYSMGFSGDGGLAVNSRLAFPEGVTLNSTGHLYFADSGNDRIREIAEPNVAPAVNVGTNGNIPAGSVFTQAGSFSDSDSLSWVATVDWGDGSSVESLSLIDMTFMLNHAYLNTGIFTVIVTIFDDGGEQGVDTLTVTVTDATPPVVTPPSNIVVTPVDGAGTPDTNADIQAFFAGATAVDAVDGSIIPTHDAPAQFPLGITTVTFQATDIAGNTGEATATVTVAGPVVLEASQDSFIYSNPKNANEGGNTFMQLDKKWSNRALVAFDQLSTLDLQGLTKATLVLTIETSTGWRNGEVVNAHRVLVPWVEGNGAHVNTASRESTVPGVTWNCATDANLQNSQSDCPQQWSGGTFAGATAAGVIHANTLSGPVNWDVTQDVQVGATLGWMLKKQRETKAGTVSYYTKEGATIQGNASLVPRLILEFDIP